ncbi:MAG: TPR end-of-group domain-containing protein, partial [Woeseiaceae bacterium]
MRLVSELRRRNVFRMAVLYAVAAWLIMQVAEVVVTLAALPDWSGRLVLALLVIGFPIALIFSWFYELTAEGLSREKDVATGESIAHITGRRMDFIVISLLSAAVLLFAWHTWWPSTPTDKSIAVLPFVNMSSDTEQEYFSDGIAEELLNLLSKNPELRVISRSSVFSYKGKNIDIPTVAAQLNVAHVLEGSVRKSGDQIRITAQLIEARSDTSLWSETYDRTLDDIFRTQDEIAARVVDQLELSLLGDSPTVAVTDPKAYALVLQARYLIDQSRPGTVEKSIALLEQALAIDPDYVAAWDGLADAYTRQTDWGLRSVDEGYSLAREAANRALVLDPAYAPAHGRLARIEMNYFGDLVKAAGHYERALAIEPANIATMSSAASFAVSLGRLDQAIALAEFAVARDPVNPRRMANLGINYLYAGRLDEAIASLRTTLMLSPSYVGAQHFIGMALLLKDETESALAVMKIEADEGWRLNGLVMAHYALGELAASDRVLAELIEKYEQDAAYNIAYVLAFRRETDRAFDWLNKAVAQNDPGLTEIASQPMFSSIRSDSRWQPFLESIGRSA